MTIASATRRAYEVAQRSLEDRADSLPNRTRRWVGRTAHRVDRLARRAWTSRALSPLVSIVVPVFNVERFLPACLESILSQSHNRLEIVAVDDGSEDRSIDILRDYASRDSRVHIVQQAHAGLGAARNLGASRARGGYLMFVDSDDVLLPGAVAAYVRSLRISGSDFVVALYQRFGAAGTTPAADWVRSAHRQQRRATTIAAFPDIQVNAVAWSKMYRRQFWRETGLRFPVGVLYEDQVVSSRAYARARRFDVLSRVTYAWRIRDDRTSITQHDSEVANLSARFAALAASLAELEAAGALGARDVRLAQLLSNDIRLCINAAEHAGTEFWDVLTTGLAQLTDRANDRVWSRVAPQHRIAIRLLQSGNLDALLHFNGLERNDPKSAPSLLVGGRLFVQLPARTELGLERQSPLLALTPNQTSVVTGVRRIRWRPDGCIEIHGWAYIDNLDLSAARPRVTVLLTDLIRPSEPPVEVAAVRTHDHEVTARSRHKYANYENASFRAVLDPHELIRHRQNGRWRIGVRIEARGMVKTARLAGLQRTGSPGHLPGRLLTGGKVTLSFTGDQGLLVELTQPLVTLETADLSGRLLTLTFRAGPGFEPRALQLSSDTSRRRISARISNQAGMGVGRIEIPDSTALVPANRTGLDSWTVRVVGEDGRRSPVAVSDQVDLVVAGGLRLRPTQYGNLGVVDTCSMLVVDGVGTEDGSSLVVTGRWIGRDPATARQLELQVRTPSGGCSAAVKIREDGSFRSEVDLVADPWGTGSRPLPSGEYVLTAAHSVLDGETSRAARTAVVAEYGVIADLPIKLRSERLRGEVQLSGSEGLRLVMEPPLHDRERGARHQEALRRQLAGRRDAAFERGAVLFRSYYGEICGCNPRAIHDELRRRGSGHTLYWTVRDHSVPVPEGGIPVVYESADWYRLLHDAEFYVDNTHQAIYHNKPAHQIQIQTFHGYPFKRMGMSHWRHQRRHVADIRSYLQRAADWDFLVSPARYASDLLRSEFGFSNQLLEIGYPRNDVLRSPGAEAIRSQLRSRLGIQPDQTAILYAPTFRDHLAHRDFSARMIDFLDLPAFSAMLGETFVVLVRGHGFNARVRERVGSHGNVVDVTDYPDVSHLCLASDAAVLDYSSLRFDYGITGKPMAFLVPDLADYVGIYRGTVLAYEPTAPGPLVESTAELAEAVADLPGITAKYADAYARFQRTYLDLDDGHASERLVDAVFAR